MKVWNWAYRPYEDGDGWVTDKKYSEECAKESFKHIIGRVLETEEERKEKKIGWINIYPNEYTGQRVFSTKEEAHHYKTCNLVASIQIEWEE